jgi:hypothetical protein
MAIHQFGPQFGPAQKQRFESIDEVPDFRNDAEKTQSLVSVYNHNKVDISLVERWTEEVTNISGAWVKLYLKQTLKTDDVWEEDPDPVYSDAIDIKAFFRPEPRLVELTRWGIDAPLKLTIVFHRATLLKHQMIGERLVIPGDVVVAPYNHVTESTDPLQLRVLNSTPDGTWHYRFMYQKAVCEVMPTDRTIKVKHD